MQNMGYFFREGWRNLLRHGFMSFAAVGITVACLLVMGSFTMVALNANALLEQLEQQTEILAFVEETLDETQARSLEASLEAVPNVRSVEFISREQAMESFAAKYEDSNLVQDLDISIFRHRYAIHIDDLEQQSQTVQAISKIEGIVKVNDYEKVSAGFLAVRKIASVVCVSLVLILMSVSVFIIANTIKMATFDRREEIAIMKMVGASDSFVRGPFAFEGMLMGLLCACIAFFLQWGLYDVVVGQAGKAATVQLTLFAPIAFSQIWGTMLLVFTGAGLVIGIGGSLGAIRKFLRV
jgi:cell division transport system permease protein